jgi:hypothetical protein
MKRKRRYLSSRGRWVISVWNTGKRDKSGKRRDARGYPWTVFYDGREVGEADVIANQMGVKIGIVDIGGA